MDIPEDLSRKSLGKPFAVNLTKMGVNQPYIYLKLPYVNESKKKSIITVIRNSQIKNIKVHFMNGPPSSKIFAPPRSKLTCPDECTTCQISSKTNRCQTKHTVYKITCNHCNKVYIGETARTVGSRIKEHLRMRKQTVYTHLLTHNINLNDHDLVSWEILHSHYTNSYERKIIEALEIQKHSNNTMNGCIGRNITI